MYLNLKLVIFSALALFAGRLAGQTQVELLSFDATLLEDLQVEIRWSTATEKNNSYFEIERSLDATEWESVQSIPGSGTNSSRHSYVVIDQYPYNFLSYYRLKQYDHDGSVKRFPMITIDLADRLNYRFQFFPNPTTGPIIFQGDLAELESMQIFNQFGQRLDIAPLTTIVSPSKRRVDLSSINQGVYYVLTNTYRGRIIKIQ